MCGICGFNWNDEALVERMAARMRHRGPDQHGACTRDGISLGHRRLSIIDLSENGRQPMANEDGSVLLVVNGEIYNFREMRAALEGRGHRFQGRSDSEVIVHAYEEYGTGVLDRLRGMFAFALWDDRRKTLLLARDRIGIKPLYYWIANGRLAFASEIKSLLEIPGVSRDLNRHALYDYMGFEFVPAPQTMFRNIHKLPAGHYLLAKEGRVDVARYWDLQFPAAAAPRSFPEAVERVRDLLDQAVASHLVSDVPLGVFLSGGLDSSAIVAMMRRHIGGALKTFTIGYPDKTFSELDYARQVADAFGTEHQVLMIEDLNADYVKESIWHLDEPMTDLSAVPLFLVCRQAKPQVTVCLSGEGGDESFAGYDRFKASRLNRAYRWIPGGIRRLAIHPAVNRLRDRPQKKGAVNMLKRFLQGAALPEEAAHLRWQYFSNAEQDLRLFNAAFRKEVRLDPFRALREYNALCNARDAVNREIYLDMRFMMTDSVLMKVDKMSMASAVEIRVPLLDHVLVEYIASLPGRWKLRGLQTKHVLRAALQGILPDNIVRRGKQGYSLPVKHLLRGTLRDELTRRLNEAPIIRNNFDLKYVNGLIREHMDASHNHNHVLWALFNVAVWQERFNVNA